MDGYCGGKILGGDQNWDQLMPQQIPQNESEGNPDEGEPVSLPENDAPDLPFGGAQGFQLTIEDDFRSHRDLKHVKDDQISSQKYQYHAHIHGDIFRENHLLGLRAVCQVGGKFHLAGQAAVRQNLCGFFLDSIGIGKGQAQVSGAEDLPLCRPLCPAAGG